MAVVAIYMGQGKDGVHLVNVRPANPKKGYLGGAGFVRRFETSKIWVRKGENEREKLLYMKTA